MIWASVAAATSGNAGDPAERRGASGTPGRRRSRTARTKPGRGARGRPGNQPGQGPSGEPARLPVRGSDGLAPVGDGGGPRADAELGVDPPDVILHGLLGQEQASGDLPVGLPVRDEGHDLRLARGQSVRLPGPVGSRAESQSLVYARPSDLSIVHLTSGCGRRIRTAANYRTRSQPMKGHANDHMSRYEPT